MIRNKLKRIIPQPVKNKFKGTIWKRKYHFVLDERVRAKRRLKRREAFRLVTKIEPMKDNYAATLKKDKEYEEMLSIMEEGAEHAKVILNPYGKTPLTALMLFKTKKKSGVRVTVKGRKGGRDYVQEIKTPKNRHRVAVFGLYPEAVNEVVVEILEKETVVSEQTFHILTKALATKLQDAVVVKQHNALSAVPYMLVSGKGAPYPFAFDEQGQIRYVLSLRPSGYGMIPLSGGRYALIERRIMTPTYQYPYSTQFYEIDLLGRVYKTYHVPKGTHHDICEMEPGGNLLTVTNSNQGHIGDVIVELDRKTGEIKKQLDMRNVFGEKYQNIIGWTHINTLIYEKETDMLYFCARNLHSVVKLNWKTNHIEWILGDPAFWKGTKEAKYVLSGQGEIEWSYQPHCPVRLYSEMKDREKIMIFDNHWAKRRPVETFTETEHSYVKIYEIDEIKHQMTMIKKFTTVKSKITSNPILPTNDRVIAAGAYLEPRLENRGGMIDEFDYASGEMLNRYAIKYYFYRGYPFLPDIEELSVKMEETEYPSAGFLYDPIRVSRKELSKAIEPLSSLIQEEKKEIKVTYQGDMLLIGAKDHQMQMVYLDAGKALYVRDFSQPPQTEKRSVKNWYYHAIPLSRLPEDNYRIFLQIDGRQYDTGCQFSINYL